MYTLEKEALNTVTINLYLAAAFGSFILYSLSLNRGIQPISFLKFMVSSKNIVDTKIFKVVDMILFIISGAIFSVIYLAPSDLKQALAGGLAWTAILQNGNLSFADETKKQSDINIEFDKKQDSIDETKKQSDINIESDKKQGSIDDKVLVGDQYDELSDRNLLMNKVAISNKNDEIKKLKKN